jgi:hypothetical protein
VKKLTRSARLENLKRDNEEAIRRRIQSLLALPPAKRTNFLRVRLPNGGSAL